VRRAAFFAGFRSGSRRVIATPALVTALLAWGLAALVAVAEKRANLFGAAGRALEGQVFAFIVPIALFWMSSRVLESAKLETAASPLARFGASRRDVALGLISASMLASALLAAIAAAATAALAHDPTAPSIAVDAFTSGWIGALTAFAYAALFAFGATFGAKGGGRFWALGFDLFFGGTGGVAALLAPRAHAQNLLGGEPPMLLGQPTSAALLAVIAVSFTGFAVARCNP
jgi:hypothetical protein